MGKNILFVCSGNTCNSPMAEYLFNSKVGSSSLLKSKSAGITSLFQGQSASTHVLSILRERGIILNHLAQVVNKDLLDWSDLVLTTKAEHKKVLLHKYPHLSDKVFVFKAFVLENIKKNNQDILDPFGQKLGVYQERFKEIEELVDLLISKLSKQ